MYKKVKNKEEIMLQIVHKMKTVDPLNWMWVRIYMLSIQPFKIILKWGKFLDNL